MTKDSELRGTVLVSSVPAIMASAPTKYELVINLKTAKALGLGTHSTIGARADEVIE
jgi:putative ABC transport system substrate-binding protein